MRNFNVDDFGPEWFQRIDSSLAAIYHSRFSIVEIILEYTQAWDLLRARSSYGWCLVSNFVGFGTAKKRGQQRNASIDLQSRFQPWGKTTKLQTGGKIRYKVWICNIQDMDHHFNPSVLPALATPRRPLITYKALLQEIMWPKGDSASQKWSHSPWIQTFILSRGEKRTPFRLELVKSFLWAKQWYNEWVCKKHRRTTYPLHTQTAGQWKLLKSIDMPYEDKYSILY